MDAILGHWLKLSEKLNGMEIRERALVVLSVLLGIYLIWDFGFFQPLSKDRSDLEFRLSTVNKELVKLNAEELVFTKALQNDPGAAKKREIVRLEQELKDLDTNLQALAVGLISIESLPRVVYEVLQKSSGLKFIGMQSHPAELLGFDHAVVDEEQLPDRNEELHEHQIGVFKHSVSVSFAGTYFAVNRYLKSLEKLNWKIYWDSLEYEVERYPKAEIKLKVFTLSTEEGNLSAGL